ncbi:PEPxxWA-CTERM sorting domain-containing protein [uncultured Phenylobacterium sp.]
MPEPTTWLVMILGFGGAGLALRRRRTGEAA